MKKNSRYDYAFDVLGRRVSKSSLVEQRLYFDLNGSGKNKFSFKKKKDPELIQVSTKKSELVYHYDGDNAYAEYSLDGHLQSRFTFGQGIDEALLLHRSSQENPTEIETFVYHQNHLGSVMGLSDDVGILQNSYEYTAYGQRRKSSSEQVEQPYSYTGREHIGASGRSSLYYYRSRVYDSRRGRFNREDDARDGKNWYGYVAGNPVRYVDPFGYWKQTGGCTYVAEGDEAVGAGTSHDSLWDLAVQLYGDGSRWTEFTDDYSGDPYQMPIGTVIEACEDEVTTDTWTFIRWGNEYSLDIAIDQYTDGVHYYQTYQTYYYRDWEKVKFKDYYKNGQHFWAEEVGIIDSGTEEIWTDRDSYYDVIIGDNPQAYLPCPEGYIDTGFSCEINSEDPEAKPCPFVCLYGCDFNGNCVDENETPYQSPGDNVNVNDPTFIFHTYFIF